MANKTFMGGYNTKAEFEAQMEYYLALKEQIDALTKEANAIKDQFKKSLEASNLKSYKDDRYSLVIQDRSNVRIDREQLMRYYPEIALEYTVSTDYQTFTIRKLKAKAKPNGGDVSEYVQEGDMDA